MRCAGGLGAAHITQFGSDPQISPIPQIEDSAPADHRISDHAAEHTAARQILACSEFPDGSLGTRQSRKREKRNALIGPWQEFGRHCQMAPADTVRHGVTMDRRRLQAGGKWQ
jgi:hypothetical protein